MNFMKYDIPHRFSSLFKLRHELLVVALLLLLYAVMAVSGRGTFWNSFDSTNLLMIVLIFPATALLHTYLLVPMLLRRERWMLYGIFVVTLLLVAELFRVAVNRSSETMFFGEENILMPYSLGIIVSWLFISVRDWIDHARTIRTLTDDAVRAELAFLKAQIHPHFLFNILNTIYALALNERAERTADSIVMLSDLMRYNLHDFQKTLISAKTEADYLSKYITLQTLRFGENNTIEMEITLPNNTDNTPKIAPLLLLPFVENVFIHGMSPSQPTISRIELRVTIDSVELITENGISADQPASRSHGVGIVNARKRLALLYPGRHELRYHSVNDRYHSFLHISLNS
ncbi:MAG: sensor histidine kinase [Bacteroidota bacterium]